MTSSARGSYHDDRSSGRNHRLVIHHALIRSEVKTIWTTIIMIVHTRRMAEKRNPLGATGETVRANVTRLRADRNFTYAQLARKLEEVGRPIPELGLRRIETGTRRVDADDLMALAAAFNVPPITLLMPDTTKEEWEASVDATGLPKGVTAQQLWGWLTGARPAHISADNAAEHFQWLIGVRPPGALTADALLRELGSNFLEDAIPELSVERVIARAEEKARADGDD